MVYSVCLCKYNRLYSTLMDLTSNFLHVRGTFYARREVDLMKTAKVNAYIMHIF